MKFRGEKVTFLGWLDNIWYHFKAPIVIAVFAIPMLIVGCVQFCSKEENDVFIYVAGEFGLDAKTEHDFKVEMSTYFAPDSNLDGKVVVDMKVNKFEMVDKANGKKVLFNPSKQFKGTEEVFIELGQGECVVYLLQEGFFNANKDYFASFEETLGYVPDNAIDGKGLRLSDIGAYTATNTLKYFPGDYILCFADKSDRVDDEIYNGNVEFVKNLIEWNIIGN